MRTALHVAAKDLRSHGVLLAVWAAALVTDVVLSTAWAHGFVVTWPVAYDLKRFATSLLAALLGALVATSAIHADATVGTTAFWLTKPLARRTLLLAKLLVVSLVLLVSAIEQWLAVAVAGGLAGDAWRAAVEALAFEALIVLPLAALAAMTADAGRLALSLVATLAAVPFVHAGVGWGLGGRFPWGPVAGLLAAAALLLALSLLVMAHQVLTRKTARSIALAVVSVVLVVVTFNSFAPSGRRLRVPAREDRGSVVPVDTHPEIQARVGEAGLGRQAVGKQGYRLFADLEVTGLPPGLVADPVAVRASWAFPGGPTLVSGEIGVASGWWTDAVPYRPLFREAIGRLLGTHVVGSSSFRERAVGAGTGFDAAALPENADRPGTLTLDIELLLVRLREAGRMPFRPGMRMRAGSHDVIVLPARPEEPDTVRVSHLRPQLLLRGILWHGAEGGLALVVANDDLGGQAAVSYGGISSVTFGGGLSHVRNRLLTLGYQPEITRDWLSRVELAAVTFEPGEVIRRIVRVEGVRFADVPPVDGRGL